MKNLLLITDDNGVIFSGFPEDEMMHAFYLLSGTIKPKKGRYCCSVPEKSFPVTHYTGDLKIVRVIDIHR